MTKVIITLFIDQDIDHNLVDDVVNEYVDELALTSGGLTWSNVEWSGVAE
jgi:hypothetical protein